MSQKEDVRAATESGKNHGISGFKVKGSNLRGSQSNVNFTVKF